MASTTNYAWTTPDNSGLVKNGAQDIRTLGSAIDTSLWNVGFGQAGKNRLINGLLDFWQRGTSFSIGTSPWTYTADRWAAVVSAGTATYAQETTVIPSGARYSMKITAGATQIPYFAQEIETMNVIPFAGQTVTFSAQVAASTSIPMSMVVGYSTNVDEPVANSHTAITATSGGTATPTSTTFVTISGTYAIPSNAKSIRVYLSSTSNITSGQVIYIGKLQIEVGSVVTPFSRAGGTIQGELGACQRYYAKTYAAGTSPATATNLGCLTYKTAFTDSFQMFASWRTPVEMRTTPTVTLYSPNTGATGKIYTGAADVNGTASGYIASSGVSPFVNNVSVAAGNLLVVHLVAEAEL